MSQYFTVLCRLQHRRFMVWVTTRVNTTRNDSEAGELRHS